MKTKILVALAALLSGCAALSQNGPPSQVFGPTPIIKLWTGCTGTNFLRSDGQCAVAGQGSVTSVGLTAPSIFSVAGSPVTASGTLGLAFATGQTQNRVLASPNGSSGAIALRALVAADLPSIDLSSGVTGNLGVTHLNSGTSASSSTFWRGDGTWATPSSGTVTSVALSAPTWLSVSGSPVTSSGTLALSAATGQTANQFLATPNGSTGAVGLRSIVSADVPAISLSSSGAGGVTGNLPVTNLNAGTGASSSTFWRGDGTWAAGNAGTVTSVGLTVPSWLSVAGSPVTGSGTLAVTATSGQTQNQVLATPNGSTGTVGLRSLVGADLPAIDLSSSGAGGVTNLLSVANGGLNLSAATDDTVPVGNGTTWQAKTVPQCGDSTHALAYSQSTNTFSCQTISAGAGGATFTQVMKGSNTTRSNTTTPTADPDLTFPSVPAGNHALRCVLHVVLAASGATPGFKAQWSVAGTASFAVTGGYNGSSNGAFISSSGTATNAISLYTASVNGTNDFWEYESGFVTTTSGDVTFLWSQQSSSASTTQLAAGSYCLLT